MTWDVPRQHPRVPVSLEVVWEGTSGKHTARMSDISMGGCYIDSIGLVSTGERVLFKVHLPTGLWVQLRGKVAHHFPNVGVGLRFTNLSDEERVLIEQVILAHGGEPPARPGSGTETAPPSPVRTTPPRRILVADDDPTIRILATVIIEKEGHRVAAARDGREAYTILRSGGDLAAAIFDMVMPHAQGLDLVRYMKTEPELARIPVGIMTAEQDPKLWTDSLAAGAGIFLPKPFSAEQFRYMLNVLLTQSANR